MAITDPQYRFASNVFDTDGTDAVYDLSFQLGYLDKDYVFATSGVEDPNTGLIVDTLSHTVSFIDESDGNRVQVSPVPEAGRKLILFRQTDISDLLVKFRDGKLLTGRNLDLSATQLIMAIQEILDGLRANGIVIEEQVGNIIDLDRLIREIYQQVLELLASGGIISVAPRVWQGVGDDVTQDFIMEGADVDDAGFYDTYISGLGIVPNDEFSVFPNPDNLLESYIHFAVPVPKGAVWFTVLRGYAKPYAGPAPITNLDIPIYDAEGTVFIADELVRWGLVRCTHPDGCEVTIKAINPINEARLRDGSYFSFRQASLEPVTLVGDPGVTLQIPGGCLPQTRAANSVVSAVCEDADGNIWTLTGDLAKEE